MRNPGRQPLEYQTPAEHQWAPKRKICWAYRCYWWVYWNPVLAMAYVFAGLVVLALLVFGLLLLNVGGIATR